MFLRFIYSMALSLAVMNTASAQTLPLSSSFVYQGALLEGGTAVTGLARLTVSLWDSDVNGTELSVMLNEPIVQVVDGIFSVDLDFGSQPFDGDDVWLEIEILEIDSIAVDVTLPRQRISPTPMALQTRGLFVDNAGGMSLIGPNGRRGGLRIDDSDSSLTTLSLTVPFIGSPLDPVEFLRITTQENSDVLYTLFDIQNQPLFHIDKLGRVGIGTGNPEDELHVSGTIRAGAVRLVNGADIAERFEVNADIEPIPGMVVSIDMTNPGTLRVADTAYDHSVAGVLSGAGGVNAGLVLGQEGTIADGQHHVALTGRVWCLVDADVNGPITPGSLLTTSPTLGHAMRASDRDRSFGATIGKAMTPLESGKGLVLVLVNLH
jgi:hypothetical protein